MPTGLANYGRGEDFVYNPTYKGYDSETTAGGLDEITGLVKAGEVQVRSIQHALVFRMAVGQLSNTKFVYPGGYQVSGSFLGSGTPLAYAAHLRLKAGYTDSAATPECNAVIAAEKKYGMYLNDIQGKGQAYPIEFENGTVGNFGCLANQRLANFDVLTPVVRP